MVATLLHNRIGPHCDAAPAPKLELPKTELERGRFWSDAVFEAVMTLRNQLTSTNEAVAAAAANSILDLERTRMRHDKQLAGSDPISSRREEVEEPITESRPAPERKPGTRLDEPELFRRHAREVFEQLAVAESERPEAERTPVTMERATAFVEDQFRRWNIRASDIPPGGFVDFILDLNAREKSEGHPASATPRV